MTGAANKYPDGVKKVRAQRTGEKEQQIRACAAAIMQALAAGEATPKPKGSTPALCRAAYRLLLYESLITRNSGFKLSQHGKKRIEEHGAVVYPNAYKKQDAAE